MFLHKLKLIPFSRVARSVEKTRVDNIFTCGSICQTGQIRTERKMSGECVVGRSLSELVDSLNKFADLSLAESWDNVGLLIEPYTEKPIKNVLLTNDLTEDVMQESIDKNIDLIISYHPPIFAPLKRITKGSWKERIVAACLEKRIAVYSPHTSWDAVYGGVNDWLADSFAEFIVPNGRAPLVPNDQKSDLYEVSVIGSIESLDNIFKGDCCLQISRRSKHNGLDISVLTCSKDVLQELREIDNITVISAAESKKCEKELQGMGRKLQVSGLNISQCVKLIKKQTGLDFVRLALGRSKTEDCEISTIALVPGSGGSLLKTVKADLFVTGEMFHHDILDATHRGISVVLTNHSDSERGFLLQMEQVLKKSFENNIKVYISSMDCDPLKTV